MGPRGLVGLRAVNTRSTRGVDRAGKKLTYVHSSYKGHGAPNHYFVASGATEDGKKKWEMGEKMETKEKGLHRRIPCIPHRLKTRKLGGK